MKFITTGTSGGDVTYMWSGPSIIGSANSESITVDESGTYVVTVTDCNGCFDTDEVVVGTDASVAANVDDVTICNGSDITLSTASISGATYEWRETGSSTILSTTNTLTVSPSATVSYLVTVEKNLCSDSDVGTVTVNPTPTVNAGSNQIITFGEIANLTANSSTGSFSWIPHLTLANASLKNTTARPLNTTSYIATLTDSYGCKVSDTVVISLDGSLYVPNSFSPNGNGVNDVFKVIGEDITEFSILIFNRWGELIFESTNINQSWNGNYKGRMAQVDTYVWKIVYSDVNTKNKEIIGHVNLIR